MLIHMKKQEGMFCQYLAVDSWFGDKTKEFRKQIPKVLHKGFLQRLVIRNFSLSIWALRLFLITSFKTSRQNVVTAGSRLYANNTVMTFQFSHFLF